MNKLYRILGISIVLSLIFISSCKDDDEGLSRKMLIANPWNLSELNLKITQGIFSLPINGYDEMDECRKDDHFVFLDNGVLQVLENTLVCPGSTEAIIASGNWDLKSSTLQITSEYFSELIEEINESQLFPFEYNNTSFDFEVRLLTDTLLKLFYRERITDPASQMSYNIEVNMTFNAVNN
jgi:hypothetical protein